MLFLDDAVRTSATSVITNAHVAHTGITGARCNSLALLSIDRTLCPTIAKQRTEM